MSFIVDISNFVEKAKKNPETVVRQVSFKLFSAIIKASPVDTGRFRMNWQAAGASTPNGLVPGFDKSGSSAASRAASYVLLAAEWRELTMTNNLPYARRLEYGWSKQAPHGMVRVGVARFGKLLAEEAAKVR
jgi:hypothetical protein